jgi:hypothetical protein
MRLPFTRPKVHCTNCDYEGRAKIKGSGGHLLAIGALVIVGLFFWPLLLVAAVYFLVVLFMPAGLLCPDCRHPHPVPLKKYQARQVPHGR